MTLAMLIGTVHSVAVVILFYIKCNELNFRFNIPISWRDCKCNKREIET